MDTGKQLHGNSAILAGATILVTFVFDPLWFCSLHHPNFNLLISYTHILTEGSPMHGLSFCWSPAYSANCSYYLLFLGWLWQTLCPPIVKCLKNCQYSLEDSIRLGEQLSWQEDPCPQNHLSNSLSLLPLMHDDKECILQGLPACYRLLIAGNVIIGLALAVLIWRHRLAPSFMQRIGGLPAMAAFIGILLCNSYKLYTLVWAFNYTAFNTGLALITVSNSLQIRGFISPCWACFELTFSLALTATCWPLPVGRIFHMTTFSRF